MNARLVFNEFAKKAQSNRDYYIFGEPSQIGVIEDVLAFFSIDYEIKAHSGPMHEKNLKILEDFLINRASDDQLKLVYEIAVNGKDVPKNNPACETADKVFVSMPINKDKCSCVDTIRKGIRDGIEQSGNVPYFLDMDAHNGNITLKMLDEIRSCKFLVADFTTHNTGVYYEAGYAAALGKTVIHTCKRSDFHNLHFDIKQTQTLSWDNAEELSTILKEQIMKSNLGK